MLQIMLVNDETGTEDIGNYNYKVFANKTLIDEGTVEGHNRHSNWWNLVDKLVKKEHMKYIKTMMEGMIK